MCPMCITTAVVIAGSATSTGGLAAIAIRKFGLKNAVNNDPAPTPSKENHDGLQHNRSSTPQTSFRMWIGLPPAASF
jgi:hypothetical protein